MSARHGRPPLRRPLGSWSYCDAFIPTLGALKPPTAAVNPSSVRPMEPKPKGWAARYGAWFEERSVADRYDLRPPYPSATFTTLASLIVDEPRDVLDAGCGLGDLARPLAALVGRVDAVDRSAAMLACAATQPGADAANLRFVQGDVETAPLDPPYAL